VQAANAKIAAASNRYFIKAPCSYPALETSMGLRLQSSGRKLRFLNEGQACGAFTERNTSQ